MDFPTVNSFTGIIGQVLPEPHAGLLSGISFGTKATLSQELTQDLITTGTLHIVALSGMNISIVTKVVADALLRIVSRRVTSLITIILIIGFVWFVGPSPSVIRAAIMGSLALMAVVFGRSNWPIFSWILAVTLMLLVNPGWTFDISFQLSALATLGIILFGKPAGAVLVTKGAEVGMLVSHAAKVQTASSSIQSSVPKPWRLFEKSCLPAPFPVTQNFIGSPHRLFVSIRDFSFAKHSWELIEDDLRVTLSAQVFTIPLILFHFHRISIISPLPNILIGWIIGPLTILGWVVGCLGSIWYPLGLVAGWVSWVPLEYLLRVVTITSRLPLASVNF